MNKPCNCALEDKVRQVELDNGPEAENLTGPVSERKVAEDAEMINPDVNTLDRG